MEKKCIIVGVTGGIAAYKACALVSMLKKAGHDVHVLMTKSAQEFVTPLTFQTLSANRVITDMFSVDYEPDVHHISLAKKADAFVVAPATADFIAKAANGIADDMLTTTFLAAYCPKLVVPAMNTHMLANPVTQDNLRRLKKYGIHIMESDAGYLACGDVGKGRMPEPSEIADALSILLYSDKFLAGKQVLITAGATQEAIDPVRCITNHSTGRMGYALARAARNAGAAVTLVSGKTDLPVPYGVHMVPVVSAKDMADAVLSLSDGMDAIIMAAAVADYTPVKAADEKIKKEDGNLQIDLCRTTDILKELGSRKHEGQVLIGFAMETENLFANAQKKLLEKNADFIAANSLRDKGAGFGVDTNKVTILSKDHQEQLGLLSKDDTAEEILKYCLKREKYAAGR
ncbi:MAG: bifunctional phosphopantothenoylcysteine decarboxylase/phosphopantothenate--cysteine ligase CoaBC [Lactimicrobium sp.]|jgi:phosphopantothenoylcysteine decarboxylase/phosphopantothenate--cysteine ligase|uniref:bifunctional phosphopantothenoylcysteine decarboxylase/phosphopantothenate--cysteine ligase CoaBC n=1 Tax=Lactimicrobium sp. TaxID=2563780 RepID=UPI002F35118F